MSWPEAAVWCVGLISGAWFAARFLRELNR
jgi:hypothetical protein